MKSDEFTYYYGSHRKRSNYVLQRNVEHKGESFHFRADFDLANNIKSLSKELDQTISKVIKDILRDFFLEQKLREQKEDVEHFLIGDN